MIITLYLRSSSYSSFDWCEHKYYLSYGLGFPDYPNKKAEKGSILHKAIELLANKKLCIQNHQDCFFDKELDKEFNINQIGIDDSVEYSYNHYITKSRHGYTNDDFLDCKDWLQSIINYKEGRYFPLKRWIICPEKFFDFEIEDEWANYKYTLNNKDLIGKLRLRGTADLVTKIDDSTIEYIDWKTGQRKNWSTGEKKDYKDLKKDFQLRLYHFAINRLFPEYEHIIVTIYYVNDGGPFSIHFDKSDIPETKEMVRKRFEEIKNCKKPELTRDIWKCKICDYYKGEFENSGKSYCKFFKDEIIKLGIDKVNNKYMKLENIHSYEGGGKTI